jgi:methylmalonyl-CoA mutase N-terminal domain/subunit
VRAFRERRAASLVGPALKAVASAARGRQNLVPVILAAVQASCTLGEISDALRDVFGEYREQVVL